MGRELRSKEREVGLVVMTKLTLLVVAVIVSSLYIQNDGNAFVHSRFGCIVCLLCGLHFSGPRYCCFSTCDAGCSFVLADNS